MRVFVTGATGLIGRRLIPALIARGDTAVALSRTAIPPDRFGPNCRVVVGSVVTRGAWIDAMAGCDAVVHLAGAGLFDRRWTDEYRKELRDSRVNSTGVLAEALRRPGMPKVFVSGSAVGYYGADTGAVELTETSPPGTDFAAELAAAWERAADPAAEAGVRVCHPRTGIVLDPAGGALPTMAKPFRFYAGGRIGSGRQYLSWIHHDDMTRLLLLALDNGKLSGPFNATAPNPVTNREFAAELGAVLGKPSWLPTPKLAIRLLLGPAAEVATGGQRALPQVASRLMFAWKYPILADALRAIYRPPTSTSSPRP